MVLSYNLLSLLHLLLHLLLFVSIVYAQCSVMGAAQCDCYNIFGRLLTSDFVRPTSNQSSSNLILQHPSSYLPLQEHFATVNSQQPAKPITMWPGGIVFYLISAQFSENYTRLIRSALLEIEANVGKDHLQFAEAKTKTGEICRKQYVNIVPSSKLECVAMIGMQLEGTTDLWLSETYCKDQYAVVHEVLHTIGRVHEHLRPDRETHINIQFSKIFVPFCSQFMQPDLRDLTLSLPYDYESIMHYSSCAGSCDGNYVMTRKNPNGGIIYSNYKMTDLDAKKIQLMYPKDHKVTYSAKRLCRSPSYKPEQVYVTRRFTRKPVKPKSTRKPTKVGSEPEDAETDEETDDSAEEIESDSEADSDGKKSAAALVLVGSLKLAMLFFCLLGSFADMICNI